MSTCLKCGTTSLTHDGKAWGATYGCPPASDMRRIPIWATTLPFEIAKGDGALIAKALRAYRPDTSEEEGAVNFFIDQFAKLDEKD